MSQSPTGSNVNNSDGADQVPTDAAHPVAVPPQQSAAASAGASVATEVTAGTSAAQPIEPATAAATDPATVPAAGPEPMAAAPQAAGTSSGPAKACPECGGPVDPQDRFCENCGAEQSSTPGAAAPAKAEVTSTAGQAGADQAGADQAGADQAGPNQNGPAAAPAAAPVTSLADKAVVAGAHDGTLLDDRTAAATDRSRRSGLVVADTELEALPSKCATCGGTIAADGYCEECGTAAPRVRDHFEDVPAPWVASVCDRGVRHSRNEDASAIAATTQGPGPGSVAVLVVCDGVSMAPDSDKASLAAARAARDVMIGGLGLDGETPAVPSGAGVAGRTRQSTSRVGVLTARLLAGAEAAQVQAAAAGEGIPEGKSPPSCTFVAAILEQDATGQGLLVSGNVGDSRGYWFPDHGEPVMLTTDDSWAAEAIAQGVPRDQAERMPQSHAITRWLGHDAPDAVPRTAHRLLEGSGWVMMCSDGLWNYASDPQELLAVLREQQAAPAPEAEGQQVGEPLRLARALTQWAIAAGGSDNITVALARYEPVRSDSDSGEPIAQNAGPVQSGEEG